MIPVAPVSQRSGGMEGKLAFARSSTWFLLCLAAALSDRVAAEEISFQNDVLAVVSKAGCNAGACHGNANGKAGFKLSLRGEDPEWDYRALTRDQFGRRTNPLDPDQSLILLKATGSIPHEGGTRFSKDSREYQILRAWIAGGVRRDSPDVRRLRSLVVTPTEQILPDPSATTQLSVRARFSDGSEEDVTSLAVYEPSNSLAAVTPDGLVSRRGTGEVTIIVRYLQSMVPVRLAFIDARPDFQAAEVPMNNYIDEAIFSKLARLQIRPSDLCSDEVFIRRAFLDLLGILPTADEARQFVSDPFPGKRARLVDQLLERPEFADFWALKWSDLLRNEERTLDEKGMEVFHRWIRRSIAEGMPLDQFVRELIAAKGSTYANPPANFYRANRDPVTRAEAVAQVFLGTRLQCAQCHNHPFDRWTQDDYYSWAALFSPIQYKVLENRRRDSNDQHEFKGEQIVFVARDSNFKNPRTGKPAVPRFLSDESTPADSDRGRLEELAAWITSPENPFFARAQANRIWFHLMGRGIVDPIDDFRPTNPASHPELLERLSADFAAHRFDLRFLIRLIMTSRAYQLSSVPNETNFADEMNYSRNVPRRLSAEQLLDCQSQVLASPARLSGYPLGFRAAQLPGARPIRSRGRRSSPTDQFLQVFGKPARLLVCECERSNEITIGQAFQMVSGEAVNGLLAAPHNRLDQLISSGKSDAEIVQELYWAALTRAPSDAEMSAALRLLAEAKDRRPALEDITWSLLNAKEFILRN